MPQDRESGRRANIYGKKIASLVAEKLGAKKIKKNSNEFLYEDNKITIRCARYATGDVGVSYAMLNRVDSIYAALEQKDGSYDIYLLNPEIYEKHMRDSKNKKIVGLVRKKIFAEKGEHLQNLKLY